jgi:uncharacterized protein (TIGR00661 family)
MNILYGVPGEGMGHATRSKVVIDYLLKSHNVQVVSSSRAFLFLDKCFPGRVHEIKGFHLAYKNAQVSKGATFLLNLKSAAGNILHNFSSYLLMHRSFIPDLVISDFESFAYVFAKQHQIPIISIDNMQVMNRCKLDIEIPKSEKENFSLARTIVKSKLPGCRHYFVSSFFETEIVKKNTTLVPPIIRDVILNARVNRGKHILVYQTSVSLTTITGVLQQFPDIPFFVYGFGKDETHGNVVFKSFSEDGFVKDLASSRAVIANGGYSFISEAVYLQKPVYSFPIKNQFEQFVNASYIDKCGYGRHFENLDADSLKAFLYDQHLFNRNLLNYWQDGNTVLFALLEKELRA